MQDSKRKGLYTSIMAGLLAIIMVFSGCSKGNDAEFKGDDTTTVTTTSDGDSQKVEETTIEDSYGTVIDAVSTMSFEEVVEEVGKVSFLDDYLNSVNYESLISDYIGFRDYGDYEAAQGALYQLGMHLLKGSVLDTLYRDDEEFAARVGNDFTLDDIEVMHGEISDGVRGIFITIDGGEKYAQFVSEGDFVIGYNTDGMGADMLGTLEGLRTSENYDAERLQSTLKFFKEFIVATGSYSGDYSVMDGLSSYDGVQCHGNEINFSYNPEVVAGLKK